MKVAPHFSQGGMVGVEGRYNLGSMEGEEGEKGEERVEGEEEGGFVGHLEGCEYCSEKVVKVAPHFLQGGMGGGGGGGIEEEVEGGEKKEEGLVDFLGHFGGWENCWEKEVKEAPHFSQGGIVVRDVVCRGGVFESFWGREEKEEGVDFFGHFGGWEHCSEKEVKEAPHFSQGGMVGFLVVGFLISNFFLGGIVERETLSYFFFFFGGVVVVVVVVVVIVVVVVVVVGVWGELGMRGKRKKQRGTRKRKNEKERKKEKEERENCKMEYLS